MKWLQVTPYLATSGDYAIVKRIYGGITYFGSFRSGFYLGSKESSREAVEMCKAKSGEGFVNIK